ncbi:hypothetical protein LMG7974_01609 [Campylobacter majalis]|uniref:Uncharacterized protein n=1 Tax=Campylobacter majalis TaxID=2790656 RepID=A0ABN7KAL5_9BACT|nr:hypothetical protein [Campylobacter majalis]CAD7289532.1 hypothetical protein LMG7974_01609 [Campylobacter majalis]
MKKIKIALLIFTSIAFGNNSTMDGQSVTNHAIKSASEGREVVREQKLSPVDINKKSEKLFYGETILNWHYALQRENLRAKEVLGNTAENMLVKNVTKSEAQNAGDTNSTIELVAVKGFCFIPEDINVGKQPSSLRVNCETNYGGIVMFADLVNVNERASLIADPKYIEKSGYRFKVSSAIVTNEEKTSYNIATFVNDRKIAEVGWGALSVGSDEFKTQSNAYLKALENSKQSQTTDYVSVTDASGNVYPQAVQNTNTEKPDPLDYLITGGINMVASIAKNTAEIFKRDLPYLYQIVGQTKIWIDLQVEKDGVYTK